MCNGRRRFFSGSRGPLGGLPGLRAGAIGSKRFARIRQLDMARRSNALSVARLWGRRGHNRLHQGKGHSRHRKVLGGTSLGMPSPQPSPPGQASQPEPQAPPPPMQGGQPPPPGPPVSQAPGRMPFMGGQVPQFGGPPGQVNPGPPQQMPQMPPTQAPSPGGLPIGAIGTRAVADGTAGLRAAGCCTAAAGAAPHVSRHGRGRTAAGRSSASRRPTRTARGAHASVFRSKMAGGGAERPPAKPAGAVHARAEAGRSDLANRRP